MPASEFNYYSDTERNLDKPIRKSMNFESFKKLDFGVAKESLTSDLMLRAKVLGAMSELKTGQYRLCNECIHHTIKEDKQINNPVSCSSDPASPARSTPHHTIKEDKQINNPVSCSSDPASPVRSTPHKTNNNSSPPECHVTPTKCHAAPTKCLLTPAMSNVTPATSNVTPATSNVTPAKSCAIVAPVMQVPATVLQSQAHVHTEHKELNHKAQEHALAVGEREAALREVEDLRDQYEAKKKECDTIQCDREVALLALKQSIEMNGEPLQRELDLLKNRLKEYEQRDEETKQECKQVKQENARMRLMYDLDRTAASREQATLQEQLRHLARQRDQAIKEADEARRRNEKLAHVASIISKLPKDTEMSDDSAIIEDDAPDGQSSNSDPSTVVIVRDRQDKMEPMSLSDVTFTEARTISGRKVNLIMAGGAAPPPVHGEKVQTLVIEDIKEEGSKYMEGLHQVVSSESPVKKVSDIMIKPKIARKPGGTLIKIDEIPPAKPRKPVKTMAMSSSNSSTSSTSSSPITQVKAGSVRSISVSHCDRFEIVCGKSRERGIYVSKILDYSLSSGKNALNLGDEIVEVNGTQVSRDSTKECVLSEFRKSTPVNIKIRSNITGYLAARDTFYVRPLFDFRAVLDTGLSFKFGQVLQVTDVESYENGWWQACKINGMSPTELGEVPSKDRADMLNNPSSSSSSNNSDGGSTTSKPSYQRVRPQHLTYVRPVVLMGTLTHKFNKRLINDNPGSFSYCLRYTTNVNADGATLRHCSKDSVMALCGEDGALIDCQRKKNEYYYTTRESVQNVSDDGKHCVLEDASIYTVDQLQKAGLHPIVILVKCTSTHEIRSVRNCSAEHATRAMNKASKLELEHLSKFTAIVAGNTVADLQKQILSAINHHKDSFWLPLR